MSEEFRVMGVGSGGGSTIESAYNATKSGGVLHGLAQLSAVVATSRRAKLIDRLKDSGHGNVRIRDPKEKRFGDERDEWGRGLQEIATDHRIQMICLLGCLVQVPKWFIEWCAEVGIIIVNQHPGWVPYFGGKNMFGARVVAAQMLYQKRRGYRDFKIGAISQFVDPEFDQGPIVNYGSIPFVWTRGARVDKVQAKLLEVEHAVQIETIRRAAVGELEEVESPFKPDRQDAGIIRECCDDAIMMC